MTWLRERSIPLLFAVSTVLLLGGGGAWLADAQGWADGAWIAATVLGLGFSVVWTVTALGRGQMSVDVVALLALGGALWVGEPFAGAMITVMLATGQL
ncbi:MAG TPA: heavy metal translocating P-type ATPase, partial [Actinotalea sp.]